MNSPPDHGAVRLAALEKAAQEAPLDYDAHLACIATLRAHGEQVRLRAARELFRDHFPLSGPLWMEWLADEERLVSPHLAPPGEEGVAAPATRARVLTLYSNAVKDYQSIPLWLKYVTYAQKWTDVGSMEQVAKLRAVHARACAAVGRHIPCGGAVWALCRDFELRLLAIARRGANDGKATVGGASMPAPASRQQACDPALQADRVRRLFLAQMAIPLRGNARTLSEYEAWEAAELTGRQGGCSGGAADTHTAGARSDVRGVASMHIAGARAMYARALSALAVRLPFERKFPEMAADEDEQAAAATDAAAREAALRDKADTEAGPAEKRVEPCVAVPSPPHLAAAREMSNDILAPRAAGQANAAAGEEGAAWLAYAAFEAAQCERYREGVLEQERARDLATQCGDGATNESADRGINGVAPVVCVYERAVAACCLDPRVWEGYARFLVSWRPRAQRDAAGQHHGPSQSPVSMVQTLLVSVLNRAVRNTPQRGALWCCMVRAAEYDEIHRPDSVGTVHRGSVEGVFARARPFVGARPNDALELWLCMCDYRRRALARWRSAAGGDNALASLRDAIAGALAVAESLRWKDGILTVLRYRALCEIDPLVLASPAAAHATWERCVEPSLGGHTWAVWRAYIDAERRFDVAGGRGGLS